MPVSIPYYLGIGAIGRRQVEAKDAIKAWHFLEGDRRWQYWPRHLVEPGSVFHVEPPLKLCGRGLHGSIRALDALVYAPGPVVCRVSIWVDVIEGNDKLCGEYRRVEWMADATRTLHTFACDEATRALDAIEAKNGAVYAPFRRAIEVKRSWLRGEATDHELRITREAAWPPETDPPWVAEFATWSACADAVSAGRQVAKYSCYNAKCDDYDALKDAQNQRLHDALMSLKPTA